MTISENMDQAKSGIVLIRKDQLLQNIPLGASTLYEEIAQGRFPKPVKIGRRASAWLMSEVEAWLDGKLSTRNVSTHL